MQQADQAVEGRQAPPLRAAEPETCACITGCEMIAVRQQYAIAMDPMLCFRHASSLTATV
jgi:hypothetical protein